jgi:broad specificity phosphatase PhoE
LLSSNEPKAVETAQLVAAQLDLHAEIAPRLHEHDRSNLPYLPAEEFQTLIADFFRRPSNLVMGRETAHQARDRFSNAVQRLITERPRGNIAIVAHGTVITLFVAEHAGIEPYAFWQCLGLPSFVVLSLPDLGLLEVVESVLPGGQA